MKSCALRPRTDGNEAISWKSVVNAEPYHGPRAKTTSEEKTDGNVEAVRNRRLHPIYDSNEGGISGVLK